MLTGGQFYDVLCAVVPLYVALVLGYGSLKWWGVVTPEQSVGISRLNAIIAMPPLIFEIIAFNDPYTMNNRLIAAYCLSNGVVLVALCVWAWLAKKKSLSLNGLDGVITLFQLSVMPNTIIVGIPVLSSLYSITDSGIAAVFIGQVLWLFPILFLYEVRAASNLRLNREPADFHAHGASPGQPLPAGATVPATSVPVVVAGGMNGFEAAPSRDSHGIPALSTEAERADSCRIKIGEQQGPKEPADQQSPESTGVSEHPGASNGIRRKSDNHVEPAESAIAVASASMNVKEMAVRVAMKMVQMPLTYSTILGIIYSLIAGRWDFGPPRILRNSLDIIGRITLGLTMYSIGLFMASQKKLVTSWKVAGYGAFCRFIVGPVAMGLASLMLGLKGDTLRFSVLQAALPQAVICFVFAKDYDLHASVFTTAISLQTIVFMPVVLAYYLLLEL